MIVTDASIWVSFLHNDIHNRATVAWLHGYAISGDPLFAPNLLMAEVSGSIARQTGRSRLGHVALQRLKSHDFLQILPIDESLAALAAEIAIECHLRGADAVYAALAYLLHVPLITWDQEQMTRVQKVIKAGPPGSRFDSNGHSSTPHKS